MPQDSAAEDGGGTGCPRGGRGGEIWVSTGFRSHEYSVMKGREGVRGVGAGVMGDDINRLYKRCVP